MRVGIRPRLRLLESDGTIAFRRLDSGGLQIAYRVSESIGSSGVLGRHLCLAASNGKPFRISHHAGET